MTCNLLSFPSHRPSGIFYHKSHTIPIDYPWVGCHGFWVEVSHRITAVDTSKHHLSVWYITRGIESCVLKVSVHVVECQSIPLVISQSTDTWSASRSTLNQHLNQYLVNTSLTLDWHLISTQLTLDWHSIDGCSIVGRVSNDSYVLITNWWRDSEN